MRRAQTLFGLTSLVATLLLASCSPASTETRTQEPAGAPAAEAALTQVDASAVPSGPSVGQLIAVQDFQDLLGRGDLTLAPAL